MKMSKLSFAPPEHPTFILPGKLRKLPTRSIESGGKDSPLELSCKVGGFGHDPKIELAQTELNQETVYCFEDQTIAEAEKLMREGNLRQLPVLTREKRMVGIVTLEDIAREQRATRS
jgi:CBS domain